MQIWYHSKYFKNKFRVYSMFTILNHYKKTLLHKYETYMVKQMNSGKKEFKNLNRLTRNMSGVAMEALKIDDSNIIYIGKKLIEAKEFIAQALPKCAIALMFTSDAIKKDLTFIEHQLKIQNITLYDISEELLQNKNIVLTAFKYNNSRYSNELSILPDTLKDDFDVVMASVSIYGPSLRHASNRLKNNKDIVLKAVANFGMTLEHASTELKKDPEVVAEAINSISLAIKHADDSVKFDYKFLTTMKVDILRFLNDYNVEHIDKNLFFNILFHNEDISSNMFKSLTANRYATLLDVFHNNPIFNYIIMNKDEIPETSWEIVKKALIENPDAIINPPEYIVALINYHPNKYIMLAHHALSSNLNINEDISVVLPELEIA